MCKHAVQSACLHIKIPDMLNSRDQGGSVHHPPVESLFKSKDGPRDARRTHIYVIRV